MIYEQLRDRLVELGCDYIQIDAPNYAQWHIDPANRAAFEEHGHDMAHELVAFGESTRLPSDIPNACAMRNATPSVGLAWLRSI